MSDDRVIIDEEENKVSLTEIEKIHLGHIMDMKNVMSTPSGMRFICRLMDAGMIFTTTFKGDKGYNDFNEGKRAFVLENIFNYAVEAEPYKINDIVLRIKNKEK